MTFRAEGKSRDERLFVETGNGVAFRSEPAEPYPFANIQVEAGGRHFAETLHYSFRALSRLVTRHNFFNILEIGTGGGTASRVFEFLGKRVTGVDVDAGLDIALTGDFVQTQFSGKFDAVWASHVIEHQRNIGLFLDKIFDVLEDDGILAITMPSALSPLMIGHPNIMTPLHLVYALVLAGFDCREAAIRQYDWQFSIMVAKKPNGVPRLPFAATYFPPISGRMDDPGYVPDLLSFFPAGLTFNAAGHVWGEVESLNWQ